MGNVMNHLSSPQKEEWQWEQQALNPSAAAARAPGASDGRGKGERERRRWMGGHRGAGAASACGTAAGVLSTTGWMSAIACFAANNIAPHRI